MKAYNLEYQQELKFTYSKVPIIRPVLINVTGLFFRTVVA